jgi:actin-related protein 6
MPRATKGAKAPASLPEKTFVLDNGGYLMKAGFAPTGEEPDEESLKRCHSVPNVVVKLGSEGGGKTYIASQIDTQITRWNEALFRRPVEHGQVVSWDAQREIWDFSFFDDKTAHKDVFVSAPEETTFILGDQPSSLHALQKNADEIIMEEWGFGGYMRTLSRESIMG